MIQSKLFSWMVATSCGFLVEVALAPLFTFRSLTSKRSFLPETETTHTRRNSTMDGYFQLSATLEGHEDDVKALVAPFNDTIISASRDRTVRVWTKEAVWSSKINFTSGGFVNSLAFDSLKTLIISGGQDKLINLTDLFSVQLEPSFTLIGHESNVCSLDTDGTQIISGSWDATAKVWENNQLKYTLEGHSASVWDVKILGKDRYLTCSADRTVKLWHKSQELKTFVGHSDVVRSLAILPQDRGFISASNDGTLRVTDFNGDLIEELSGHDSFVYSVKLLSNGDIVSCGEDRSVRIWRDGKPHQVIRLPCISVWTVAVLPNDDVVVGSSDNSIRIFTRDAERAASKEEIKELQDSVESMALNSEAFDESKASAPEVLQSPGSREGQVVVVKSPAGVNEAYQWTENKWTKIGEVVSGSTSDKKVEYDGKKWDFVFDVDVKDGEPALKLPYNVSENPYVAASRFLEKNELPTSYTDQVVQFITTNTQGVTINQQSDYSNPYADTRREKLVPHKQYLGFTLDNHDSILKGLKKFNDVENTFDMSQLSKVENDFKTGDANGLLSVSSEIITTWSNKLVGFDILRYIINKLDTPPAVLTEAIRIGLDPSQPPLYFMTLRMVSNVFLNERWGESIITDLDVASKLLKVISFNPDSLGKHQVNVANAIATVLLNFSIYTVKYQSKKLAELVLDKLQTIGGTVNNASSEAAYRLTVAYGNLVYFDAKLKLDFEKFKASVKYQEQRFTDLFNDIDNL